MAKVIIFSGPTAGNLYNFVYLNESKDLAGRRVGGGKGERGASNGGKGEYRCGQAWGTSQYEFI